MKQTLFLKGKKKSENQTKNGNKKRRNKKQNHFFGGRFWGVEECVIVGLLRGGLKKMEEEKSKIVSNIHVYFFLSKRK